VEESEGVGEGKGTYVLGHDDGADHAGAQVALLSGRNEVFRHCVVLDFGMCQKSKR